MAVCLAVSTQYTNVTDSKIRYDSIYTVPKNVALFIFWNNLVKNKAISIIFSTRTSEET